ncbi:hypothetical protein CUU66_14015 [Peribacillus deserti]|uniref:Uncharacterized protein n=1 Tax=Peribacillus deserti TaxID=673318 RepID=A0A2N5M4I3_9BACI|nr:hypothetical protein CUU66_14015 [Peribacillus deserti]
MISLLKLIINILFVFIVFGFAYGISKLEEFLERKFTFKMQRFIIVGLTVLTDFILVEIITIKTSWSFTDTLFFCSLIIPSLLWMGSFGANSSFNYTKAAAKFNTGADDGTSPIYKVSISSFAIGTLLFTISGVSISFIHYYKYFI